MQFLYSKWLALDLPTRHRIAEEFGIVKKGSTHVQDNIVVSDGFLISEVEQALNLENMQRILNTEETDVFVLWDMLVNSTPVSDSEIIHLEVEPEITAEGVAKVTDNTGEVHKMKVRETFKDGEYKLEQVIEDKPTKHGK